MSIESLGFSPWETLNAGSTYRVTITAKDYFVTQSFPAAAASIRAKLWSIAGLMPFTTLSLLNSDDVAVIDGNIHNEIRGADFLNRLESLSTLSAAVARVERLTGGAQRDANTDDGARDREDVANDAQQEKAANSVWNDIKKHFGTLTTFIKWGGVLVGAVAVAYVVHEFKPGRK